jgi:glycerol-3-phosphate cytidylyltransferase-like family protein
MASTSTKRKESPRGKRRAVAGKSGYKLYQVRKYVIARSAEEALKISKRIKPDDCWVDDDWKKKQHEDKNPAIGFEATNLFGYDH